MNSLVADGLQGAGVQGEQFPARVSRAMAATICAAPGEQTVWSSAKDNYPYYSGYYANEVGGACGAEDGKPCHAPTHPTGLSPPNHADGLLDPAAQKRSSESTLCASPPCDVQAFDCTCADDDIGFGTPSTLASSTFSDSELPTDTEESDGYPLDALTSFICSIIYSTWYRDPPHIPPEIAAKFSGPQTRPESLFSHDQPLFVSFLHRLLTLRRPNPYVVQRATQYICRLRSRVQSQISRTWGSHYAVFAVALLLSTKVLDDAQQRVDEWARASGIPGGALRRMEIEFADMLDWRF